MDAVFSAIAEAKSTFSLGDEEARSVSSFLLVSEVIYITIGSLVLTVITDMERALRASTP